MWQINEIASSERSTTFQILKEGQLLTHKQFLQKMLGSRKFREFYNRVLADCEYPAFLWENKPMSTQSMNESYECRLINTPFLANVSPDRHTFNQYFDDGKQVVSFQNLGRDAQLIAPCPQNENAIYSHIGRFVRGADDRQIDEFWRCVAQQMLDGLHENPRWLSTNGMGVFWLHVRIDTRPKYYQTEAYKRS